MPASLIEDNDGVGSGIDGGADLLQVLHHGKAIAERHDKARSFALARADGAEDVGPFGALILGRRGSTSPLGPPAGDFVLLTDASLVLEPNLYLGSTGEALSDFRQAGGELFLKSSKAYAFCS